MTKPFDDGSTREEAIQGKDSIGFEKNTKGFNFSAKCYVGGNGDKEDTSETMKNRLLDYKTFLEENFSSQG
jgi:hypothetical protein